MRHGRDDAVKKPGSSVRGMTVKSTYCRSENDLVGPSGKEMGKGGPGRKT